MGILDSIKNIMTIPDEEEFENETEVVEEAPKKKPQPEVKRETTPRVIGGKAKNVQSANGMQVVLVKPNVLKTLQVLLIILTLKRPLF